MSPVALLTYAYYIQLAYVAFMRLMIKALHRDTYTVLWRIHIRILLSSKLTQVVTLLTCIRAVPGLNLD
jgi:hypothetical protein